MATPEDLAANAEFIRLSDGIVEVPGGSNRNNYANVDLIVEVRSQASCTWYALFDTLTPQPFPRQISDVSQLPSLPTCAPLFPCDCDSWLRRRVLMQSGLVGAMPVRTQLCRRSSQMQVLTNINKKINNIRWTHSRLWSTSFQQDEAMPLMVGL